MQAFLIHFIDTIAQGAGLPADSFMSKSVKDNVTIKQPRLEYEFSPSKIKRSGKVLGVTRNATVQTIKRERYTIEQDVNLTLYSEKEDFRQNFCTSFMEYLPRNTNDAHGNFIKISYSAVEYVDNAARRIGDTVISVDNSFDAKFTIRFLGRFCTETTENLIQDITINTPVYNR